MASGRGPRGDRTRALARAGGCPPVASSGRGRRSTRRADGHPRPPLCWKASRSRPREQRKIPICRHFLSRLLDRASYRRVGRSRETSPCVARTADVSEMCPRVQRADNNKVPICRAPARSRRPRVRLWWPGARLLRPRSDRAAAVRQSRDSPWRLRAVSGGARGGLSARLSLA
jgi:hypothetical protein